MCFTYIYFVSLEYAGYKCLGITGIDKINVCSIYYIVHELCCTRYIYPSAIAYSSPRLLRVNEQQRIIPVPVKNVYLLHIVNCVLYNKSHDIMYYAWTTAVFEYQNRNNMCTDNANASAYKTYVYRYMYIAFLHKEVFVFFFSKEERRLISTRRLYFLIHLLMCDYSTKYTSSAAILYLTL